MPTPNHNLPLYGDDDTAELDVLLNGQSNALEVALNRASPAGQVVAFAGATAPDGWLLCDGSSTSRSAYPALFSAIGTAYGAGDGSTTFGVPNLKGRIPVGRDAAQSEFDTLGEAGGEKTHTLTEGEMPSHDHNPVFNGSSSGTVPSGNTLAYTGGNDLGVRSVTMTAKGGNQPHNNLQPYVTLNYIIKT